MYIECRADGEKIEQWLMTFDSSELASHGWETRTLKTLFASFPGLYLFTDDALASCLIYQRVDENHYEILFLATSPLERRKGFQEQLLYHFFRIHPKCRLWLECREDNFSAIALYTKMAFVRTGKRYKYYRDGMDAILMEKKS